jgi:hypothetical protein
MPGQNNAMVIIEGDYSRGTGFLAKLHGQFFVITNQHVLSGNQQFTITGMDGTKYPSDGPIFASRNYDIALIHVPVPDHALDVAGNIDNIVGDPVAVPGNSDGADVITLANGRVLGFGPQLVEVDAKFVHGNSGSPIIDRNTGQVIGVATFVTMYNIDDLRRAANVRTVRWFGYRLDNIKDWDKINWKKFSEEGVALREASDLTDALVQVLNADSPVHTDNQQVNDALDLYSRNRSAAIQDHNDRELQDAIVALTDRLRYLCTSDLDALAAQDLYPFHAREAADQTQVRTEIDKFLLNVGDLYNDNAVNMH